MGAQRGSSVIEVNYEDFVARSWSIRKVNQDFNCVIVQCLCFSDEGTDLAKQGMLKSCKATWWWLRSPEPSLELYTQSHQKEEVGGRMSW